MQEAMSGVMSSQIEPSHASRLSLALALRGPWKIRPNIGLIKPSQKLPKDHRSEVRPLS